MTYSYDLLIQRATVFDGTGTPPVLADVAVTNGRIAEISITPLPADAARDIVDGRGQWLMPGFIDIHTHYDAEMLIAPGLQESLRHGVTTCVVGSCSISMIYTEPEDASDIFTRVESIPREFVLPALRERKTWCDARGYIDHIQSLPLGPNIASYMGHSDLRVAVMGLKRAVDARVKPTENEFQKMERHLHEGLDLGLLGLSGMTNPWDKLDGDRERSKSLPSTYAGWSELRRLHRLLRQRGAILQSAPNLNNPINAAFFLATSASWGLRPPLKTTLITLMDIKAKPGQDKLGLPPTHVVNHWLGGDFRWQALPQPFQVYADGIDFVVFEEFPAGEMALHLTRELDRNRLFADPDYRARFKREYQRRWGGRVWHRDFGDARVMASPDPAHVGKTIRVIADERGEDEAGVFLDLLIEHGSQLRWSTVIGNHNPARVASNLNEDCAIIGFSDAGAHLRNMAFYNFPLCLLQLTAGERPVMRPEKAVWRLTGEIADWYGLAAGKLHVGAQADMVLLNPQALLSADLGAYHEAPFEELGGLSRVVNRNDGIVKQVWVNGRSAFANDQPDPALGRERGFGRYLPRQQAAPAH
ncbi:MAG: N-acyl-D-glutamate amidohydrolase [Pseudomonadota bacterium]|nr:N-acyl-D-glutamate amidohydrolase [Pseudomonadota bacterium]